MNNREFWVARDGDGDLYLYDLHPQLDKKSESFYSRGSFWALPQEMFPSLTFENSPQKVFNDNLGEIWIRI